MSNKGKGIFYFGRDPSQDPILKWSVTWNMNTYTQTSLLGLRKVSRQKSSSLNVRRTLIRAPPTPRDTSLLFVVLSSFPCSQTDEVSKRILTVTTQVRRRFSEPLLSLSLMYYQRGSESRSFSPFKPTLETIRLRFKSKMNIKWSQVREQITCLILSLDDTRTSEVQD